MRVESLTDLKLRKLKPADTRLDIWDARIPGFGVRVAPTGTKTFVLMYRLHGKKRRISLGRYPEVGLAVARQSALQMRAQVACGESPLSRTPSVDLSFSSVLDNFLELHCKRHNKLSTQRSTRKLLENECLPLWRDVPITEITRRDIIAVLDAMVARGSAGAANNAYAAMSKFFNWCASRDLVPLSPFVGVERSSKKVSRDHVLTDDEVRDAWFAADALGYPFGHIVQLLLLTAQRRGEVACMEWHHIDWDAKLWSIPPEMTKNGRPHTVPLCDAVLSMLKAVPRLHERFVFPARGRSTTCFSGFGKCKERLDKELSIEPWRLHDLRRTAATGMAQLGVQPHIVECVLNHASGQLSGVAGIYNRFDYLNEKRDALARWSDRLAQLTRTNLEQ